MRITIKNKRPGPGLLFLIVIQYMYYGRGTY